MPQKREAAVVLLCVADDTGSTIHNSLQLVCGGSRWLCQDNVAVVNTRCHKCVNKCCCWSSVQRLPDPTYLSQMTETSCTHSGHMFLQAQVRWQRNSEQRNVLTGGDDVCTQSDGWGTSTKFRQTVLGAAPDEFKDMLNSRDNPTQCIYIEWQSCVSVTSFILTLYSVYRVLLQKAQSFVNPRRLNNEHFEWMSVVGLTHTAVREKVRNSRTPIGMTCWRLTLTQCWSYRYVHPVICFTRAGESVADITFKTGTGKASRRVGAVRLWTAASVIHSTFIHICHNTSSGLYKRNTHHTPYSQSRILKRIFCHTLPAPFFILSTSFCSLSSFTSSCAYHLITVTTFALITSHCLYLSFQI